MPNVQQPEMRRSGRDPLVQDSVEQRAQSAPGDRSTAAPVPEAQRSTHGPRPPRERTGQTQPEAKSQRRSAGKKG